jgi:hypothetical protein
MIVVFPTPFGPRRRMLTFFFLGFSPAIKLSIMFIKMMIRWSSPNPSPFFLSKGLLQKLKKEGFETLIV